MKTSLGTRIRLKQFVMLAGLALASGIFSASALAQSCDDFADRIGITSGSDARVTLDANEAVADDKEAIECAFEAAAENGISRVQLQAGDFFISQLEIEDFVGSFEGRSISATTLNTIPEIIECGADVEAGKLSAAIRFVGGQPRLRTMTIEASQSCIEPNFSLVNAVHFTGQDAFAECESDLTQAVVDRVVLEGPGINNGVAVGIAVYAQGRVFQTCRNTLLGTFKLNRSEIMGFNTGVLTSMQGGAQVDINFNECSEVLAGYQMRESRQITSVTLNEFSSPMTSQGGFFDAVFAVAGSDTPDKTALTVSGNDFHLQAVDGNLSPNGVTALGFSNSAAISLVVKENDFMVDLTGLNRPFGVNLAGVSNAVIIDNDFEGTGRPVSISSAQGGEDVADNAVLANDFDQPPFEVTIEIDPGVLRSIIGPAQDALVLDFGTGTILTDNSAIAAPLSPQARARKTKFPGLDSLNRKKAAQ